MIARFVSASFQSGFIFLHWCVDRFSISHAKSVQHTTNIALLCQIDYTRNLIPRYDHSQEVTDWAEIYHFKITLQLSTNELHILSSSGNKHIVDIECQNRAVIMGVNIIVESTTTKAHLGDQERVNRSVPAAR